ncbi:Zn-ribbon domain-containing OB-fold protein [Saccharopolyspora sp. ASAGF58]|uniref:Zn-ribbon domain-containing OB-fold protein n=1 Tax=Saccharopolyspora sp. ASAGF58 TaxID=2719023 RepID=UPI0014402AEA|nr:Zn-ribbon domain-containing OB-fold protein [Saccharopolyspora sp. ASAGF58]QIZ37067.1 Zn-ribbon domain-containing OB-fold protein [Saccharopolyspora sp. ASAGF58]
MVPAIVAGLAPGEGAAQALPTPTTRPFWDAAAEERLSVQRCESCEADFFYPRVACPFCGSREVSWVDVSGRATLLSYVINHLPAPGFETVGPHVIAIVRLEEGPTMMTNIVGVDPRPEQLLIDMPLQVAFEERYGQVVPVFVPRPGGAE